MPERPALQRQKPLREQLHEAVNENLVRMASDSMRHIDGVRDRALAKLEKKGIVGCESIADDLSNAVKKLLLRGLK